MRLPDKIGITLKQVHIIEIFSFRGTFKKEYISIIIYFLQRGTISYWLNSVQQSSNRRWSTICLQALQMRWPNWGSQQGDVPRSTSYGVYISQLIRFARVSSYVVDFNARNKSLTAKLLQQGYRYHKLRKAFSKFYRRHYESVSKSSVGLKTLLHQGLSEPEFYGDLVYKFKKIVGRVDVSDQFRKIIVRYKRIGYNINIMRQSACLVFNPITVNNFASLFNCTPVGRASDSMMAPT